MHEEQHHLKNIENF